MNLRLRLNSAITTLILGVILVDPALASPTGSTSDAWTTAPRAFVMFRSDAPKEPDEFIRAIEAAGGHVSVLLPSQAAWVYAGDEALASPKLRRWISRTHRERIQDSEIVGADTRERRAARLWNKALTISDAMRDGPLDMHVLTQDVRIMPRERGGGSYEYQRLAPSMMATPSHLPLGADSTDQSAFMAGSVAVGIWLLEAAGSEYDWSDEEEAQSIGGVMAGMDAWVRQGGTGASLSFVFDVHTAVPVSGVPILEDAPNRWVSEALTQAGFQGPPQWDPNFGYPAYYQARTYNNWVRNQLQTNWCFSIFILDSDPAVNAGQLPGGGTAWAYLGGPYVYMSRYSTWSANAFAYYGVVPMHETGHIFYATDEYDFNVDVSGYLNAEDNPSHPDCIMNENDSTRVCQPTRNQLGWRDLDQDGIIEVLDAPPTISIDPTPVDGLWSGSAEVTIVPSPTFFHSMTIDRIDRVELRVDAGPWTEAVPADGGWGGYAEGFQWAAPPLCDGSHVLRARAHTIAGNWSGISSTGFQTSGSGNACGPWLDAPDSVIVSEGMVVQFTVSATDPDGEPIGQFQADVDDLPVPNDASFEWISGTPMGTFHWSTTPRDSGVHEVVFTATNSLSGTATTSLRVINVDQPPVLSAPASVEGQVGTPILFDVLAMDPDGDPITYLSADLPTFATFEINPAGSAGQFRWIPVDAQAGTHVVVFRAYNLLQVTASTTIQVAARPPNPVVTAPDTLHVEAGQEVSFFVEVFEPSGELVELKASGLPPRATFHDNGDWTGYFHWVPGETDRPGSPYMVSFIATNPAGYTGQTTTILMMKVDHPPVLVLPGQISGTEGAALEVVVAAVDPDGDPIQALSASPLPPGAVFEVASDFSHGVLRWTPDFTQSGVYSIQIVARSASVTLPGSVLDATGALHVTILDSNRPPVADAGGPYRGVVGEPIAFEGGASSDPDGDPLQLTWDFGDGVRATGVTAAHSYTNDGDYDVVLSASDGTQFDVDSTTTAVTAYLGAEAFFLGKYRSIPLVGSASAVCLQIEPTAASYDNQDLDFSTLVMHSEGTGDVSDIPAEAGKDMASGDRNHDGVNELTACFRTTDLRRLFSALSGRVDERVSIRGRLFSGAAIRAEVSLTIIAGGGMSISPNPIASRATLSWRVEKPGPIRLRLFDVQGRLVRTLYESTQDAPGYHDLEFNRETPSGTPLAAGIYFLLFETRSGEQVRRVAIVR